MESHSAVKGNRDFAMLWTGLAISQAGTAIGMVALPVVAVAVLGASTLQVSLLAASSAITAVLIALPIGPAIEFRRKRPVMIGADLTRFLALASIPAAAWLGVLTFWQLCVVAAVNMAGQVAFNSASQANLVGLVPREQLVDANGKLQSTTWLSLSAGPSIGGVLVGALSAVGTLLVDAVSYLASAAAVWLIRRPEPAPPARQPGQSRSSELLGGMRFVASDGTLRRMLFSWVVFAGCVGMTSPLSTVFYLRDLHFTAVEYGIIMGVPSLAGFAGARLTRRASSRLGAVRALWWASVLRGPWYLLIPIAMPGKLGVAICCTGFAGVLFFSAMANSAMTACRQLMTPDHLMSRVATLWSFATTVGQPLFIVAGGVLGSALGTRTALVVAALTMCASALILPRHASDIGTTTEPARATAQAADRST